MTYVVVESDELNDLLGNVRIRGMYAGHLDNFLASGNVAIDVTSEFPNKQNKLESVAGGFRQAISNGKDSEKYKGIQVIAKKAEKDGPVTQVVLYNKPLHDQRLAAVVAASE